MLTTLTDAMTSKEQKQRAIYLLASRAWAHPSDDPETDEAFLALYQNPRKVEVLDLPTWDTHDPIAEYEITLLLEMPGVRIVGQLGLGYDPRTATLEFQMRYIPWRQLYMTQRQQESLLAYLLTVPFTGPAGPGQMEKAP